MKKIVVSVVVLSLSVPAFASLGIMDTTSETAAKTGASNLGILDVYDHPSQVSNGNFYVPVQYNRTVAEGNGTEHDANYSGKSDIDYIPLAQLKGANGAAGSSGTDGLQGVQGNTGDKGDKGDTGAAGKDASIDGHTFINLGAAIRWYDWKNVSLVSGYRYDFNHNGHTIDAMVFQIKLGKSFEDRKVSALQDRVDRLERLLTRLAK